MKWPFVRRSKYDNLQNQVNCLHKIHGEYAQLNHDNLHEINRLNQELASELNSHRETKKNSDKLVEILRNDISTQQGMYEILELKNEELDCELKETKDALKIAREDLKVIKDHEQKLFEAHDKLNQQNMGLLYENEKLLKQINQLRFDKSHLKNKVKKLESKLVYFDAEYTIMKKNADWFYGNYCRFKDMIEKSGYFPGK